MDNPKDYTNEYLALKAMNDRLRESGLQWLWGRLDRLSGELNRRLVSQGNRSQVQIGRQDWQFKVENSVMVGQRFGLRHSQRTLTIEVGWPRESQHGIVPGGGLARGRIGLSRNPMFEPQTIAELTLNRQGQGDPVWHVISNNKLGEHITESHLRNYLKMVLADPQN